MTGSNPPFFATLYQRLQHLMRTRDVRLAHALGLSEAQAHALRHVAWLPKQAYPIQLGFADGVVLPRRLEQQALHLPVACVRAQGIKMQVNDGVDDGNDDANDEGNSEGDDTDNENGDTGDGSIDNAKETSWIKVCNQTTSSQGFGSLAAILRAEQSDRLYMLTAAHVLADMPETRWNDQVSLANSNDVIIAHARLNDWHPVFHQGPPDTEIDVALARMDLEQVKALLNHWELPSGEGQVELSSRLYLRTRGYQFEGTALGYVSAWLDLDDDDTPYDYRVIDGLAYRVSEDPMAGDSGAPIWDEQRRLIAMHIAAGIGGNAGNGLAIPIGRILNWSKTNVVSSSADLNGQKPLPVLAQDGIGQPAARPIQAGSAPPATTVSGEVDVLARTIWAEARGEGETGMLAVANVIANRKRKQKWWGKTIREVCLKPSQFSCWNENDPNRRKLLDVKVGDPAFDKALKIAEQVINGEVGDNTMGATYYYARSMRIAPKWAQGHLPCAQIGNHIFFNDVN
jgi:hypothetical protein